MVSRYRRVSGSTTTISPPMCAFDMALNALSSSLTPCTSKMWSASFRVAATDRSSFTRGARPGASGFPSTATWVALGTASLKSSAHFPANPSSVPSATPVMFPPGCPKLTPQNTTGTVLVIFLAVMAPEVEATTSTSTLSRISSAISSGKRSGRPSAHRSSMTMVCPSTYLRSRRPCRKASRKWWFAERDRPQRSLSSASFPASAPRRRAARQGGRRPRYRGMFVDPSLYDLIRPLQERLRDRQAEGLGGLEVDDQLELGGLLDGKICGLGALEDSIHVPGSPTIQIGDDWPVGHETTGFGHLAPLAHHGKPVFCCQRGEALLVSEEGWVRNDKQARRALLHDGGEGCLVLS